MTRGHTHSLNKFLNSQNLSSASEHSDNSHKTGYFVIESKIGLTALTRQVYIRYKYADGFLPLEAKKKVQDTIKRP